MQQKLELHRSASAELCWFTGDGPHISDAIYQPGKQFLEDSHRTWGRTL